MKILSIKYQRNGISGNGFHSVLFEGPEYQKEFAKGVVGKVFLATFESTGDDEGDRIDIPTCRVENLKNFKLDWRGDVFGCELQEAIDKYCDKLGVSRRLCDASFPPPNMRTKPLTSLFKQLK